MDFDLDLNSENSTMTSFLELEKEIEEVPFFPDSVVRPSVIVKPRPKASTVQPSLTDIMSSCGIEYDLPEDCNASSPSSIHSDIQLEQNNALIEQLEEFFIKTEGKPTVVEDESVSNEALSTTLVTPDGQNVIIIIAPSSPTESVSTTNQDTSDLGGHPVDLLHQHVAVGVHHGGPGLVLAQVAGGRGPPVLLGTEPAALRGGSGDSAEGSNDEELHVVIQLV